MQKYVKRLNLLPFNKNAYHLKNLNMGQCTNFGTIAYAQMPAIKAHVDVSNKVRGLNFGLSLYLYFNFISCMRAGKALVSLHMCADSTEPSLFIDAIRYYRSCADQYIIMFC